MFVKTYAHPAAPGDTATVRAQEAYLAGSCAITWVAWMAASIVGIVLANWIPQQWGLGFAGILALLGICCSLASSPLRVVAACIAGAAAVVAFALPLKLNILVAIGMAVVLCLLLENLRPAQAVAKPAGPPATPPATPSTSPKDTV